MLEELFKYIEENNIAAIKEVIISQPKLIEEADEQGVVAVFIAAKAGHFELVRYMMEYTRVSMNIVDHQNQSILHYAAASNHKECFKYLVKRISMDPFLVNKEMESPLDIGHKNEDQEIIDYYEETFEINKENIYYNLIVPGTYPDPSIIRVGDDYYMVNSSFFYFTCIPIQHSKDLIHWHTIGHAVTDKTYIDVDGIDPSLFTDDDGRRYMLLNRGARILEISHEGDQVLSEPKMLWYGDNKRAPEAPHLLKHNGYYYCFVSEGGTGINHQISVARSKQLDGPYEKCPYNPILKQNNSIHPIQRWLANG